MIILSITIYFLCLIMLAGGIRLYYEKKYIWSIILCFIPLIMLSWGCDEFVRIMMGGT